MKQVAVVVVLVLLGLTEVSQAASVTLSGHTPPFTATAIDLGPADPATVMQVSFWLKLRQPERLAVVAEEVYDRQSPSFHRWLSASDFAATYAPTADALAEVKAYAQKQGFRIVAADPGNWYVSAQATADVVERAFHVELHRFLVAGSEVIANTADPEIDETLAPLLQRIGGLNQLRARPLHIRADTGGKAAAGIPLGLAASGTSYDTVCFKDTETVSFSTSGAIPEATYTGTGYGAALDSPAPNLPPCGYGPPQVQKAYGVDQLIKNGIDGSGQTVVIVDAFGSPTVLADAEAHAALFGLPAPVINILQPAGPPVTGPWNADEQDWSVETSLDVEYVHAMAPGATIDLVEAASDSDGDLSSAVAYAVENNLGYVISNSWDNFESFEDQAYFSLYEAVFQVAVARGISVQFGSGDYGDDVALFGYADVQFPSSSPYVTSVGGTTLALNPDGSVKFQTGWGNNRTRITQPAATPAQSEAMQVAPYDPPVAVGFYAGSSGGASRVFAKPAFQQGLPGNARLTPDISYLADPYTGVEIVSPNFDDNGNVLPSTASLIGGTSLACPMFTAMWALADQAAGAPLGQAARALYDLPKGAITDVLPLGSPGNVTGSVTDSNGVTTQTALALAYPETMTPFVSALYDDIYSPNYWYVMAFGTDSSLAVGSGWDPVTGLGVPNGERFVEAVSALR